MWALAFICFIILLLIDLPETYADFKADYPKAYKVLLFLHLLIFILIWIFTGLITALFTLPLIILFFYLLLKTRMF
jgi:hypothetical protein